MPLRSRFLHHFTEQELPETHRCLIENAVPEAPSAARTMKGMLDAMKEITVVEPVVTVRGRQGELIFRRWSRWRKRCWHKKRLVTVTDGEVNEQRNSKNYEIVSVFFEKIKNSERQKCGFIFI